MWLKLGNDFLNLDHVVRVKFNKGWKNGQEDLIAEVEALIKGEVQVFTRYRGVEAQLLHATLRPRTIDGDGAVQTCTAAVEDRMAPVQSMANTVHDLKIP